MVIQICYIDVSAAVHHDFLRKPELPVPDATRPPFGEESAGSVELLHALVILICNVDVTAIVHRYGSRKV